MKSKLLLIFIIIQYFLLFIKSNSEYSITTDSYIGIDNDIYRYFKVFHFNHLSNLNNNKKKPFSHQLNSKHSTTSLINIAISCNNNQNVIHFIKLINKNYFKLNLIENNSDCKELYQEILLRNNHILEIDIINSKNIPYSSINIFIDFYDNIQNFNNNEIKEYNNELDKYNTTLLWFKYDYYKNHFEINNYLIMNFNNIIIQDVILYKYMENLLKINLLNKKITLINSIYKDINMNKVLLYISYISKFSRISVNNYALLIDINNIKLLTLQDHIYNLPNVNHIKTLYGWEIITKKDIFLDDIMLILYIPKSYLHENNKDIYDSIDPNHNSIDINRYIGAYGVWNRFNNFIYTPLTNVTSLEEDREDPYSWITVNEIVCIAPYVVHPNLLYVLKTDFYGDGITKQIIEIWKPSCLIIAYNSDTNELCLLNTWLQILSYFVEEIETLIDSYYLSIILRRGLLSSHLLINNDVDNIETNSILLSRDHNHSFNPRIGVMLGNLDNKQAYIIGINENSDKILVALVEKQDRNLIYSNANTFNTDVTMQLSLTSHVKPIVQVPKVNKNNHISLDPGQQAVLLQYIYGLNSQARDNVAFIYATEINDIDIIGSQIEVLKRRKLALSWWLISNETYKYPSINSKIGNLYCNRSDIDNILTGKYLKDENLLYNNLINSYEDGVTILMTTCKRIDNFIQVIKALEESLGTLPHLISNNHIGRITNFIIIDDSSSENDRELMVKLYPNFTYIFKNKTEVGHANSLNKLFKLIKTRYFLYLEDDWLLLKEPVLHSTYRERFQGNKHIFQQMIDKSIEIIQSSINIGEPIAQVLLNNQISSLCARGLLRNSKEKETCNEENLILGGWLRWSINNNTNDTIPYLYHEFGLSTTKNAYGYRDHTKTNWPSLGLNPGIWDMHQLRYSFNKCLQKKDFFDENDSIFEHTFSLLSHTIGLNLAYLPSVLFEHIGEDISAYKLNGFDRPWEKTDDSSGKCWDCIDIFNINN